MRIRILALCLLLVSGAVVPCANSDTALFHGASLLHAHNCYPEDGRWADRIDRALATGLRPVAIEQDLVWVSDAAGGRSVVSHGAPLTGQEPTLEEHFFRRVAPLMEQALRENQRSRWPLLVLHLDFKSNEPEHHRAVWELLGKYQAWLTTAERSSDPKAVTPFDVGPLLVLTENGANQLQDFHDVVPVGARLRLFGTVASTQDTPVPLATDAAALPRSYRRWVNLSWIAAEGEPQPMAMPWSDAKAQRLERLVNDAHAAGLWMRFYTLNGYAPADDRGWSPSYNFGTADAVRDRWRAAIRAGVDFIATDQYEDLASELSHDPRSRP